MVHAGCVLLLAFARTCMSGSFESLWWNVCVHRWDLSLSSHPKKFKRGGGENGVITHIISKGKKSPLPEKFSVEKDRTHITAWNRTASSTYYQWAILALCCHQVSRLHWFLWFVVISCANPLVWHGCQGKQMASSKWVDIFRWLC